MCLHRRMHAHVHVRTCVQAHTSALIKIYLHKRTQTYGYYKPNISYKQIYSLIIIMNIFVYASLNAACVLCSCCVRVVRVVCIGVLYVLCELTHMCTSARTQTLINEHAHTLTHSHKQKHPLINMHTHTQTHIYMPTRTNYTHSHILYLQTIFYLEHQIC